ncbi:nitrophenyl compound nitroreductase subunit ArsF family protein [Thalassobellus citreus]|uniref:nitrophenyl compound nitroreductase subunit ArsF family protein n=1 Tax=Thalassobellus citreus TaxID=3367752 RepID=UPI0037B5DE7B
MKLFKFLSVLIFSITLVSCNGQTKNKTTKTNQSISKIEVIDFHSTHRCMTCNAIEASTKYTLETYFTEEVKNGKITFQVINVDDKKNEKISENFEASGTALFLNVVKNGKEKHIDLTEFAFMNGNEKEVFANALKLKIENELKTL